MKLKHGVSLSGLHLMAHKALAIAEVVYKENGQEIVVTAGTENPKEHMENSSHAYGRAVDLRVRYFLGDTQDIVANEIRNKLYMISRHYKVILHKDHHIHIQWNADYTSSKPVEGSGEAPA